MANLLQQGDEFLAGVAHEALAIEVTYARGDESVAVQAVLGRTDFASDDGTGAVVTFQSRDYLIVAADLMLAGAVVSPQPGDQIVESDGLADVQHTYEVLPMGNVPCWAWSDPYRRRRRVRTKEVASA